MKASLTVNQPQIMKNLIKINFIDSWFLAKNSFEFLCKNKDLNLFPILNLIVILIAMAGVIASLEKGSYEFYAAVIVIYFAALFLVNFFNTAFVAILLRRLNKESGTIFYGLHTAKQRVPNLLWWTCLASLAAPLGNLFESFQDLLKTLFGYSIGLSWSLASYFFLPILVVENIDPLSAMKRSTEIIGEGWKNTISVKIFAVLLFIFILILISDFLPQFPSYIIHLIILLVPTFLVFYLMASALEMMVMTALFLKNAKAREPAHFDTIILNRAFAKEEE